jgi:ATP-dependent 26S proteasome regulatory subunit
MGYLFCGPVGTGKTYLAECLAGEAGVPVVTMRNFRDKWVGSTEANLEKIFSLLHALGRCIVFVDEADQALGKRQSGSGDSGVSSRVYSMMAKEMSNTRNRGKILWVLASSRPDLIEVDLKRPGRVDVKIPLFPSLNPKEGFSLILALCKRRNLLIPKDAYEDLKDLIPTLLTPGAAEAISVQTFRIHKTTDLDAHGSLKACLSDYRPPVPMDTLKFQMRIAAQEATDASLIPSELEELLEI